MLRVRYLLFNRDISGSIDLAAEAVRLTLQLLSLLDQPEVRGLLALMLLHHARRAAASADPPPEPTGRGWILAGDETVADLDVLGEVACGAAPPSMEASSTSIPMTQKRHCSF